MANKTIDRKKAVPARSQAAKASPKSARTSAVRPGGAIQDKPSDLKQEKAAREALEVEEVEEVETEELVTEEEVEADEELVDEEEEEVDEEEFDEEDEEEELEEEEEEQPARSRARKERDLMELTPVDYSVARPAGSRMPKFPGSQFLLSSYRELRLVTWPSRRDTWNWSLVVVGVCVAVALLLGAADLGFSRFVTWWVSLAH